MIVYVVAARIYSGDAYRTRYYVECVDGKPRMGDKADASCFGEEEAATVCRQLNDRDAFVEFFVMDYATRPPHVREAPARRPEPKQEEIAT